MKKRIICMLLTLLMTFSTIPAGAFAQESDPADYGTPGVDYAEGEAIVYVDGGAAALNNANGRSRSAAAYETEELMAVEPSAEPAAENSSMLRSAAPASGKSLVLVKSGQDTESLIEDLQSNPNVAFAEPNYYVKAYDIGKPDENKNPGYKYQWALKNQLNNNDPKAPNPAVDINAEGAWQQADQPDPQNPPVVAVLDSGVDYTHPDLENKMWTASPDLQKKIGGGKYGYNAIDGEVPTDPMDTDFGHGTHCAGVIAAEWDNNKGGAGVSRNVQIMAVRFISMTSGDTAAAIRGYAYIQAAAEAGVNVVAVNNSWGPSLYDGRQLRSVSTAVTAIGERFGVVSCFAAGNNNVDNDLNTGSIVVSPYAVNVGAMDSEGYKVVFSNYGKETVDVFAPGSQILSATTTFVDDRYPMNQHDMPVQYLPQIQDNEDSYFYEDFEATQKVDLRLLDGDGKVVDTAQSEELTPGCASGKGLKLPLDSIAEGHNFTIEMVFSRDDLKTIDRETPFHIAFQGGCDNALYGGVFFIQYQNKEDEWVYIQTTQGEEGNKEYVYMEINDHNWNQASGEVSLPDFAVDANDSAKDEVVLRLVPGGMMYGKTDDAAFRLDNVGFGKKASDYYYASGTSMATPVVTGIAALLSTTFNADKRSGERAAEVCARIKGGVNREGLTTGKDLKDKSVSDGFVDAGAAFDSNQCVPVLNNLKIEGDQATLTGYFFGAKGTVSIGGQDAAITDWTDTAITFTMPQGLQGKQEVVVRPANKDYGRNFFQISNDVKDYKTLTAPNLDLGSYKGYGLTSADLYPLTMAATDSKLAYLSSLWEASSLIMSIYDIATGEWQEKPASLPENILVSDDIAFYSMTAGKTKFYLLYTADEKLTGEDGKETSKKSVRIGTYDPAADTWKTASTELIGTERLVVYKDQLLAIGGDTISPDGNGTIASDTVRIINPDTGETTESPQKLPEGRSGATVLASGDTLMLYGGTNGYQNPDKRTYTNTMSYDGTGWTSHEDNFLSGDNADLDKNQTLSTAFCALNGEGMLAVGPVHNLNKADMMDTWSFNGAQNKWDGVDTRLYSQAKTTQTMGAASGDQFYVLGYTGKSEEPLVFRSTTVDYTGPTADPSGDQPTPPEPSPTVQPTVNPTPTATPTDATTSAKDQNAGTGIFGGPSGMALTAIAVLLLAAGGLVVYRKRKG